MSRKDTGRRAEGYRHPEASALLRPDVGTQAQFRKKKKPATWRYDPSLSPVLDWDGENPARERAESNIAALQERIALLAAVLREADADSISDSKLDVARNELNAARAEVDELQALSSPFLNWAGKAERLSFDVPTLPLFVHERLSTAAIVETLKGHKRDRQTDMFDLFGESNRYPFPCLGSGNPRRSLWQQGSADDTDPRFEIRVRHPETVVRDPPDTARRGRTVARCGGPISEWFAFRRGLNTPDHVTNRTSDKAPP